VAGNSLGFEWTKKLGASHADDNLYLFRYLLVEEGQKAESLK